MAEFKSFSRYDFAIAEHEIERSFICFFYCKATFRETRDTQAGGKSAKILHDGKNNKMVFLVAGRKPWLLVGGESFPNSSPSGHKYASILKYFENQRAQKTSSPGAQSQRLERGVAPADC
jgi:hypothetical protein